jgi:hypothetical protein
MAAGSDGQLLGGIEHVLVVQAKVPGQLINSDFAAAGHSGLRRAGPNGPPGGQGCHRAVKRHGHSSSCLRARGPGDRETSLKFGKDGIRYLTAQCPLEALASPGLIQTSWTRTEIGRTAHPPIQS